jgi:intracellular sulfur oxidation DsrE/DsrF family protein
VEESGFKKVREEKNLLKENYLVVFEKAATPTSKEKKLPAQVFPVIEGYGGVFDVRGEEGPRKGTKVVFDVMGDAKEAGQPVPGLARAAFLYNLAGRDGIKSADIHIAIVLHGAATKYSLSDEEFKKQFGKVNPNAELIRRLTKVGAKVYVCGQSVIKNGFEPKMVASEVIVASSALTTVINKQAEGYAYIPAP